MKKNFIIAIIVLGVIILLIIIARGEVCRQQGPIVLDPVTKKPLTGKTCIRRDTVIPF